MTTKTSPPRVPLRMTYSRFRTMLTLLTVGIVSALGQGRYVTATEADRYDLPSEALEKKTTDDGGDGGVIISDAFSLVQDDHATSWERVKQAQLDRVRDTLAPSTSRELFKAENHDHHHHHYHHQKQQQQQQQQQQQILDNQQDTAKLNNPDLSTTTATTATTNADSQQGSVVYQQHHHHRAVGGDQRIEEFDRRHKGRHTDQHQQPSRHAEGANAVGLGLPAFDNSTASVVTAMIGRTVFLPCRIRNIGDRTVSWIRRADLSVLSVGRDRYIQDRRFQVMASSTGSPVSSWALQLAYPNPGDSGVYECQLGSVPKLSRYVTLRVIARTARIWGGPQLYVNSGSGVNLTCQLTGVAAPLPQMLPRHLSAGGDGGVRVNNNHHGDDLSGGNTLSRENGVRETAAISPSFPTATSPFADPRSVPSSGVGRGHGHSSNSPTNEMTTSEETNLSPRADTASHVFWYHNGEVINYEHMKVKGGLSKGGAGGLRAGVSTVEDDPSEVVMMMSVLRIRHARASDSGNYSCAPSDALPAHITLHVLHDEHPPAAMQDPQPSNASGSDPREVSSGCVYWLTLGLLFYADLIRVRT